MLFKPKGILKSRSPAILPPPQKKTLPKQKFRVAVRSLGDLFTMQNDVDFLNPNLFEFSTCLAVKVYSNERLERQKEKVSEVVLERGMI